MDDIMLTTPKPMETAQAIQELKPTLPLSQGVYFQKTEAICIHIPPHTQKSVKSLLNIKMHYVKLKYLGIFITINLNRLFKVNYNWLWLTINHNI